MKVYSISDLHLSLHNPKPMDVFGENWTGYEDKIIANWQSKITADDIVLVPGDISWAMSFDNAMPDIEWLAGLNGKKVLLRGNHDYWWKSITSMRNAFPKDVYALQNDSIRFDNILLCGTRGWTVPEGSGQSAEDAKIFARETERLKLTLNDMQKKRNDNDYVIALTHFPPFNSRRQHSAVTQLLEDYRVDKVVYGHLHGKSGRIDIKTRLGSIEYYLCSCDIINFDPVLIYEK